MNNSMQELLGNIEPQIRNIEENRIECTSLKNVFETIKELVDLGENYKEILNFYDQEFIIKAIKIGNSNSNELINKYKSSKYLLQNNNKELLELPQFKEAINYMEELYKYLYGLKEKIKLDYETKSDNLKIQELLNKYYNLLNKENIFIKDPDEFLEFLEFNDISIEKRIDILIYINKCNVKNYITTNDIDIGNNINLSQLTDVLMKNKNLIHIKYDLLNENYTLDDYLKENKNNLVETLNDRKIFLINKIDQLYQEKKYSDAIKYYDEVNEVCELEKEFEKQKKSKKLLYFLFKNDKSLVREYLDKANLKYKSCVLKNLLDLEINNELYLPETKYNEMHIYVKKDFVVKTVFTFIDDYILILGVVDKGEVLKDFVEKNKCLLDEVINNKNIVKNLNERDLILKDIKLEDLVLSIDLETLDINMEDKNGR